jgi:hypothetical protein
MAYATHQTRGASEHPNTSEPPSITTQRSQFMIIFKPGVIAILCVRALCAAIIIAFALGYNVRVQVLQVAELVTVCLNALYIVMALLSLGIIVGHGLLGTGLPKPSAPRTPLQKLAFGMAFALELAAFGLIGWWFSLGVRITAAVIQTTMPRDAST